MRNRGIIMNDIIKVWSFRRSGTNYLCGTLYINFYQDRELEVTQEDDDRNKIFNTNDKIKIHYNKWKFIFGGHHFHPPKNLDLKRNIYIKRDPLDTAYSLYAFRKDHEAKGLTFKEYIDKFDLIQKVKDHNDIWEATGIYTVHYEDIYENTAKVMEEVEKHFGLKRLNTDIISLDCKVGWNPNKGVLGEGLKNLVE
jgi:hypothetical protein